MLHGIHCIQSCCIKSTAFNRVPFLHTSWNTAFNHASWNPLHSIGMNFTTLNGVHCIQSQCMESTAFNEAAWNPLHSIGMLWARLNKIHCIHSGCMGLAAWTPLHTIRIHCATMHGILAFIDAACNPMYSIGMLWAMLHKIHYIQSCFMESTALNHAA